MSYTFPERTQRWDRFGVSYSKFEIHYICISFCSYNLVESKYHITTINEEGYTVDTPRLPEFEAGFPEFPYNCCEYVAKLRSEKEKHNKRIELLETNVEKLLLLTEKLMLNANKN